ncbi:MAG: phosphatidylethanolamine-binding protein [Oscillospiraceae bacterium]|nr:phosphatidylethanolamine-binding protein [Oscillospiraceae bacterium]
MKHINRLFPAAAALLTLLSMTACGASSDAVQESAAEPAKTSAASEETAAFHPASLPSIMLTSENLHDGVWDAEISNTNQGANRSPQLAWQPVEGASCYAIYMVDTTVNYWLHWKSLNITETSLAAGSIPDTEYIGPYPPSGTHDYEIRVFALKEPAKEAQSRFDNENSGFEQMTAALDQTENGSGNILAYGTLTGSYTRT